MSAEGQIRYSVRHRNTSSPAQINRDAHFWSIADEVHKFLGLVQKLNALVGMNVHTGRVDFELREIKGWQIYFDAHGLARDGDPNSGIAEQDDAFSGDFVWSVGSNDADVTAKSMAALALYFIWHDGQRVRFDHEALTKRFNG